MPIRWVIVSCLIAVIPAAAQLPNATVHLGWDPVIGATGYRVTLDGVTTDVGLPATQASCQCVAAWVPVIPAQAHTVTVSAYTADGNVSGNSAPLSLPTSCGAGRALSECWAVGTVTLGWALADVGFVNPPGNAAGGADGAVTLRSGGLTLGGTTDGFTFTSVSSSTNGALTARVASLEAGKAGLDWREDTTAQARHVALTVTPAGGADLVTRAARAGSTRIVVSKAIGPLPVYLRLTRGAGNTFTAAHSADGVTWTTIGSVVQPLPSGMRVGLLSLSGSSTVASVAQFDHIVKNP